jgi:hypothetical protein
MKDLIEITFIWLTHVLWLLVLFAITSIGLGILKGLGLSYENSICCIYGYILGLVCNRVINRNRM